MDGNEAGAALGRPEEASARVETAAPGILVAGGLMLASALAAVVMQALARHLSETLHPFEIAFFRNLFGFAVLVPWLVRDRLASLKVRRKGLYALRSLFQVAGMLMFFYAISITPLAQVSALNFTTPLFIPILAVMLLGERLRPQRVLALLFGFAGMIVIVRPGFGGVGPGGTLVVTSCAIWAIALTLIKILSRTDSALSITAIGALVLTPLSLVPALFVWQWPSFFALALLGATGLAGTLAQISLAEAFKRADATAIMPLDFTKLLWASLIGYLFFAEIPDVWTWTGGFVIFASTTYLGYRESREGRRVAA